MRAICSSRRKGLRDESRLSLREVFVSHVDIKDRGIRDMSVVKIPLERLKERKSGSS